MAAPKYPYRPDTEIIIKAISVLAEYQKSYDISLKTVKMDVDRVKENHEAFTAIIEQIESGKLIAAHRESEDMADIIEIKSKVNDIDASVRKLETDVAVIKNTLDQKFASTESTLKEIRDELKEMRAESKTEFKQTRDDFKAELKELRSEGITSKRYNITTAITFAALLVAIITSIAAWINASK